MKPLSGNGKVYLGIPRERFYFPEFVDNRDLILTSMKKAGLECGYFQAQGHRVDRNRDRIVLSFLKHEEKPEWLLMLDSDMQHLPDIATRLVAHQKPIVGALYFFRGDTNEPLAFRLARFKRDEYYRMHQTWSPIRDEVYDFIVGSGINFQNAAVGVDNYPGLVEVDALGTGAMLIHRNVLEEMDSPWFEYETGGASEDLMFCMKAKQYGFPIYCDMTTISGHYKIVPMGYSQFFKIFRGRGVMISSYTVKEALGWMSEFFNMPLEQLNDTFKTVNGHDFGDYWKTLEADLSNEKQEYEIYRDPKSGFPYVIELLIWNSSEAFLKLREQFLDIRDKKVIDIGAGIGTLSLQLMIQRNDVLAVEVNPVLRNFIQFREKRIMENIETRTGNLLYAGDEWLDFDMQDVDAVFAIDVFEHMPLKTLKKVLHKIGKVLKPGGRLYFHNNFGQQEIFPMHHDYSAEFNDILNKAGLFLLSPIEAYRRIENGK